MATLAVLFVQLVTWPLVPLLAVRAARGGARLSSALVIVLVVATALSTLGAGTDTTLTLLAAAALNSALYLLFAVYPDGRAVPQWMLWPAAAGILLQLADVASGFTLERQPWWPLQFALLWPFLLGGGQIRRYRTRSSIEERRRTRWPILAVLLMVACFTLWMATAWGLGLDPTATDAGWLATVLVALPALGFAAGLLMPARVNVDRALLVTVHVGLASCALAWLAFALRAGLEAAGIAALPAAWLCGVGTALCTLPVVAGAGRIARLTVYGRRRHATAILSRLGRDLASSSDPRGVPQQLVNALVGELGLRGARLSPGSELDGEALAEAGTLQGATSAPLSRLPVRYQGEQLAEVSLAPRPGDATLAAGDRELAARMIELAAPALHGAGLLAALAASRSRLVAAREEERRRLRRELHDELAPTFAGLALSAAATAEYARAADPRAEAAALQLSAGLQGAARQLRSIAYGLRPPALDERGLLAAIRDGVSNQPGAPVVDLVAPAGPLTLATAVESTAFRIVQESVGNVRRHAGAARCTVTIALEAGMLHIEVSDDGVGLPEPRAEGVGIRSMRERTAELGGSIDIGASAGGGCRVRVTLPAAQQAEAAR